MTHLILVPLTWQASYEQLVGAVLHYRPHNLKLVQVNDRVRLCEAQCDSNVVVIVVGPTYLHHHMQLLIWSLLEFDFRKEVIRAEPAPRRTQMLQN